MSSHRKWQQSLWSFPLPIQFKNEAKHEDCLSIMDKYEEQLVNLFKDAFGKKNQLNESRYINLYGCIISLVIMVMSKIYFTEDFSIYKRLC
jgi:hypothetical protein